MRLGRAADGFIGQWTYKKFKVFFYFDYVFIEKLLKKHDRPESHLRINSELRRGVIGGFFSIVGLCYA
jgi:hypothetical protein